MSGEVYDKLQEKFDSMPLGYPKTDSGVEIDILRSLYNEEEAEMALSLPMLPRATQDIAEKAGRDPAETANLLERMANKGLAYRLKKGEETRYCLLPFLPGIWELQVKNLTPEFNEKVDQYYSSGLGREVFGSKTPYFKIVPNDKNIPAQLEVFHYEQVSNIVKNADKVAVLDCLCRLDKKMQGKGCDKPLDVCMAFGPYAHHFIEQGIAREVSKEEAIEVLNRSEEAGLVHSSINIASGHTAMCNCCSCCCVILRSITQLNLPTAVAKSDFYAQSDPDLCTGCGTCMDRCHVNAINIEDDIARVLKEKCIGCGLCVSTCPTEAMVMVRKPEEKIKEPPARIRDLLSTIAEEKGRTFA